MSAGRIWGQALRAVSLLLFAISVANAQGPARTISLTADRTLMMAGEQIRISARTRDAAGLARPDETFTWTSSNPSIVTVDSSGVATGVGLGTATIAGGVGPLRSTISIEVLPARVEVLSPRAEIRQGEQLQLTAVASNVFGDPIPNVGFRWELTGANGGITRAASISDTGMITATANALVTAKASVVY